VLIFSYLKKQEREFVFNPSEPVVKKKLIDVVKQGSNNRFMVLFVSEALYQ